MSARNGQVSKRRVFYIPGFDPYPPRRYRELYRKESDRQADLSGYDIAIKGRTGKPGYSWLISAHMDGQRVQTRYDVLVWHDLVQQSMDMTLGGTYLSLVKTSWLYVRSGALRRLAMLRKGPVIAALYPVAALLLQFLLALLAASIVTRLISSFTWPYVGIIIGLPVFAWILRWFQKNDHKFFAYYLMHDYAFTSSRRGANPPELEKRLAEFRTQIHAALNSDVDEVLIVGHSSGAHMAINILADMERAGDLEKQDAAISLLTLGQVVPMVSFLPTAARLRGDLALLSVSENITWVDVSAPGDGCSFALCDPVAVTGVAPPHQQWPLVVSAAFSQTLLPETWARLKRRYFRLHFQYLCAFDQPGDYDYFQISAGPLTLGRRYRGRRPSKSRIDVPASPYTSISR